MKHRLSYQAEEDLESIWHYTYKNWSIEQADRYLNQIIDEIEYLSKNPYCGKDISEIKYGYFRWKVRSHFIFYKIDPLQEILEVIRILHQSMDIPRRLDD